MKNNFAQWLAFIGAADCVLVPSLFTASIQQPFFPLPALYFIEIAIVGLIGLMSSARDRSESPDRWRTVPWLGAGILLAFNILGAWTIGFFLIPGTISFLAVGFLLANGDNRTIRQGLTLFLIIAVVQGALMLALVNIL